MAEPLARELGLEVVRIRIMGGNRPLLQIMIEKAGGAPTDVEDCATFSRNLSPVLEAEDPISEAYRLEVSTPGIDRPLTRVGDFGRWIGHLVKIELTMPLDGRRRFQGTIAREDERGVAVLLDDESELVAQVHEMTKASLILTDELIDAASLAAVNEKTE
ncbi:MAG: ribosome maturation factor RimP, partial [Pseudomonadota bacterium]